MRKILIGFAAVVVLLIAAVLIGPSFLDWNQYKPQIAEAARKATGRGVSIDGDIRLRLLPAPALSAAEVRIGNIEGGTEPDMARLRALEVEVALVPLLSGQIDVNNVRLVEPVAVLEVLADGRANWQFARPQAADVGAGAAGRPAGGDDDAAPPLSLALDRFEVVDGMLIFRDAGRGAEERISGVNLSGSAATLRGPFTIAGSLVARDVPVGLDLQLGELGEAGSAPLRLDVRLRDDAVLEFSGRLAGVATEPTVKGVLKLTSDDLAAAAGRGGIDLPPALAQAAQLNARVTASANELAFNDLALRIGETSVSGAVNFDLSAGVVFDAALTVGRLDLDAMLRSRQADAEAGPAGARDAAPAAAAPMAPIPQGIAGNLSLSVDGINYRGSVVRQVSLAASLRDGELVVSRAAALLPGGSDASLSGRVTNTEVGPQFDGRFEFASDSLRTLLSWLDIDVAAVPADRLTSLSVTTAVSVTPELLQVADANIRMDTIRATAAAAYRLQQRPSFGLSLSVDRLNLDAYRPPAAAGPAAASQGSQDSGDGAPPAASRFAALDGFDANLVLRIDRLTTNGINLNGVTADVGLSGGMLTARQLRIADLAGGNVSLTGSASGFADQPELDLRLDAAAPDLGGLARLFGLDPDQPVAQLRDLQLTATARGSTRSLSVQALTTVAGAAGELNATARDLLATPAFELSLAASHGSLAGLSDALQLEASPEPRADGPVELSLSAEGGMASLDGRLGLQAAAAQVDLTGSLQQSDDGAVLDAAFALRGADLNQTLSGLGVAYRPALQNPGPFALSVRLGGAVDAMSLNDLEASVGPFAIKGDGALALTGERPRLTADLAASEIIVDLFLPRPQDGAAPAGAGGGAAAPGREDRWSREPIDLSPLQALDAELKLAAAGLVFQRYPFVEPRLALRLDNGVLSVEQLTGRLFEGAVALDAEIRSRPVPDISLDVRLDGADIEQAMQAALEMRPMSGRLDFQGSFRSRGASQRDLVRGLNGTASLAAADGVIRGFDMRRFSDRLQKLNRTEDYIDLLDRAFSGGETKLQSAEGSWQIADGVARTEDTRAELEASRARMNGEIDLANWRMALLAVLELTEHDGAPALGVELSGPLDAPRRDFKTREIEAYLAARLGQELLRKELGKDKARELAPVLNLITGQGGKTDAEPGQAAPQDEAPATDGEARQPQPAGDPEKALQGLLKELLKR